MFGLGPATRIYLAAGVTDMRNYALYIDMRTLINTGAVSLGSACSEGTRVSDLLCIT